MSNNLKRGEEGKAKEAEKEREKVGACTSWQCGLPTINQERQIRNSNDIFFVLTKQWHNL